MLLKWSHWSAADLSSGLPPARLVTLSSPIPSLMQSLRTSALKTVKRTRQSLAERLGHGSKTVDVQLDTRIGTLRDIQHRYTAILQLINSFTAHFTAVVSCHQALDAEFSDLAQKMPELHNEFAYNAETQRTLHKNGETLLGTHCALVFICSLQSLLLQDTFSCSCRPVSMAVCSEMIQTKLPKHAMTLELIWKISASRIHEVQYICTYVCV